MSKNAAYQEVDELERAGVSALTLSSITVTVASGTFTVSDTRSGNYQDGNTVTWTIKGLKKGDELTIASLRSSFPFSYQGTCPGKDFDISGTLKFPATLPTRETWDPAAPLLLIPYSFNLVPAVSPRAVPGQPGGESAFLTAPGDNDPCLVIDTMGDPDMHHPRDPGNRP